MLVQDLSLKFHYRMFASRTSQTSSIVYLSVVDQLVQYFLSQNGGAAVTVSMGIDPADDRSVKLLTRVSACWHCGAAAPGRAGQLELMF